jgi:hypothetical protein
MTMTITTGWPQDEYDRLSPPDQDRVFAGGQIGGIPLHCECGDVAVFSTGGDADDVTVACYSLRCIARALSAPVGEQIRPQVSPEWLLTVLRVGLAGVR